MGMKASSHTEEIKIRITEHANVLHMQNLYNVIIDCRDRLEGFLHEVKDMMLTRWDLTDHHKVCLNSSYTQC